MWQCFIFILQHAGKLSSSNLHSMKLETNRYRCLHAKIGNLKFSWKPERSPNSGRGDIHTVFSFEQDHSANSLRTDVAKNKLSGKWKPHTWNRVKKTAVGRGTRSRTQLSAYIWLTCDPSDHNDTVEII